VVAPQASWGVRAQPQHSHAKMRARRLAARWLLPVEGRPIERGALLIGADGRIEAVGPDRAVPRPENIPAAEFPDAAILPGLINTHTHLELTGLAEQVQALEFPAWIRHLRQVKSARTSSEYLDAARQGLRDCFAAGVTTIADTGDSGAVIRVLSESDGSGIAYLEVFGPHPAKVDESLADLQRRVAECSEWAASRVQIGVSPHAPYTVSGPLFQAVGDWARAERLPLAVHIAESAAESEFLLAGTGPFADTWLARDIPLPPSRGKTPVEWVAENRILSEHTLCIHAVQIRSSDVDLLARSGAAVAHCPQSNLAHGHGLPPLQALLDAGIRVGLGTDSVVSVGRLDLLAEARAAGRIASLTAERLLELCTLGGARALGIDSETGSLVTGKWADCVVVRLPPTEGSPAERVLAGSPDDVMLTYLAGREVHPSP
jgi:cytosine/adenosine deaminase-related metal-dependent hydrolase